MSFRPFARATVHFGRIPWWRILLGIFIVLASTLLFIGIPTHDRIVNGITPIERQEAAKRVARETLEMEVRQLALWVDLDQSQSKSSKTETADDSSASAPANDPPRIIISADHVVVQAGNSRLEFDARKPESERAISQALRSAGVSQSLADEEAKRAMLAQTRAAARDADRAKATVGGHAMTQTEAKDAADETVEPGPSAIQFKLYDISVNIPRARLLTAPEPIAREPLLSDELQARVEQSVRFDWRKIIFGVPLFIGLLLLSILLLIARGLAARSVKQTQRVKVVEAAAKVDSSARQIAEAQLKALQAQVEPHFLFNTLAHVKALQDIDVKQSGQMLDHLIVYLRTALPNLREGSSTLAKEFDLAQSYLNILKLRMGDRLQFSMDLPESLKGQTFPPAMLINLVENAVKHGVERARGGGSIRINAQRVGELISLTVADTGKGLDTGGSVGTGVGLASIRDRIKMLYGDAGSLRLEANSPTGVIATLMLPAAGAAQFDTSSASDAPESPIHANVSEYKASTAFWLALFGGIGGAHHWYLRRKKSAFAQAFLGFAGMMTMIDKELPGWFVPLAIWLIADLIMIKTKSMKDGFGKLVVRETNGK